MAKKEITKIIKLQLPAGTATPAASVGMVLGPAGVNIGEFINQFNTRTRDKIGNILPVVMNVYNDRTFDFIVKKPPASNLIKKALGIESGSGKPNSSKVGKISKSKLVELAKEKMEDMNTDSLDSAVRNLAGTARSMGVDVTE